MPPLKLDRKYHKCSLSEIDVFIAFWFWHPVSPNFEILRYFQDVDGAEVSTKYQETFSPASDFYSEKVLIVDKRWLMKPQKSNTLRKRQFSSCDCFLKTNFVRNWKTDISVLYGFSFFTLQFLHIHFSQCEIVELWIFQGSRNNTIPVQAIAT